MVFVWWVMVFGVIAVVFWEVWVTVLGGVAVVVKEECVLLLFGAAHPTCDIARSGPADSLSHTVRARRMCRSIAQIIVARRVVLSLPRCGRNVNIFCILRTYNFHLSHTINACPTSQPPETMRTARPTRRRGATLERGQLPCHSRQCGQLPRSRLYRKANPVVLCSIARPHVRCTVARGCQSTRTWLSASLRHSTVQETRPDHTKNLGPTTRLRTSTLVLSKEETTIMTTGLTTATSLNLVRQKYVAVLKHTLATVSLVVSR